jgi:very-short-patch-repair endonuclease
MPSLSPLAGEGKLSRSDSRERGRRISKLRDRAKEMRSRPTDAEYRLWQILRAKRFLGYKFRQQVPIDFYIADFVCFSQRLILEVDSGQHAENPRDEARDAYLRAQGFRLVRIWNKELFDNEEGVAELILSALRTPPLPNPSPARGEGLSGASNG